MNDNPVEAVRNERSERLPNMAVEQRPMSESGLLSRVSPIQTAMCTRFHIYGDVDESERTSIGIRVVCSPDVATSRKDHRLQQTGQPRIRARARQSQQEGQIHFPR